MNTPTSLQRLVKRRLLSLAVNNTQLTNLVPAGSINPDGVPNFPFILIDDPRTQRLRLTCVRGALVTIDVHAFAMPREESGHIVETAYDYVSRIGAALETVFADNRLTLESGAICKIEFSDTNILKDDEPEARHWFGQLNCRVLAE